MLYTRYSIRDKIYTRGERTNGKGERETAAEREREREGKRKRKKRDNLIWQKIVSAE